MNHLKIILSTIILTLCGCSVEQVEEYSFRKSMEFELLEKCGDDQGCQQAVKDQIKGCMESSDWRTYLNAPDSEEELLRFVTEFYGCLVDAEGQPYFEVETLAS